MNTNNWTDRERESITLDDVLDEYMSSSSQLDYKTMMRWVERYPQYKDQLIEFTLLATMVDTNAPTAEEVAVEDLEATVARHMGAIQSIPVQKAATVATISGLIDEGKARGLTVKGLADALGLSITLLNKLDRRLIKYQSIPGEIVGEVARVLSYPFGAVARYLQGPALHAVGANYRANEAPSLPEQQDFADAVADDRSLSADRKRQLLEMGKSDPV